MRLGAVFWFLEAGSPVLASPASLGKNIVILLRCNDRTVFAKMAILLPADEGRRNVVSNAHAFAHENARAFPREQA
jgi:hypothetical protein